MDGKWQKSEYWGGFDKNNIVMSDFHASVPEAVRQKVLAEKKKLEAGQDEIFAGPIYDQSGKLMIPEGQKATDKDLLTMRWLMKGVNGRIPQ